MKGEWVEIVPPLPMKEAKTRFDEWKEKLLASGQLVDETDIREDCIRAANGWTFLRYLIRAGTH